MNTDGWEQAGLYDPEAPGADERRALLEYLSERGATIQQMVDAHQRGTLPAVAGDLVMRTEPATLSLRDVAERCGVTIERVQRVSLALGLPALPDAMFTDDRVALVRAFEQGAALLGDDALTAFSRVLGAAASSIAEAAVALFYAELGPGTGREGTDELARAHISETATVAFGTVPDVLSRVLLAQFERAAHRAALVRGWTAPSDADPASDLDADLDVPSIGASSTGETVALGFVDLVGSTSWAEGLTLRDHSLALSRFESAAWSSAVLAGGRVVKLIGDEVFFAAPSVDAACRIGTDVCEAAAADPLLPPARGAVGYGLATPREGDYFGPLVNLISRLTKTAPSGMLVATVAAADALTDTSWLVEELEPRSLKGLDEPTRVFAVTRAR